MYAVTVTSPIFILHPGFLSIRIWKLYISLNLHNAVQLNPLILFTGIGFMWGKKIFNGQLQVSDDRTAVRLGVFHTKE